MPEGPGRHTGTARPAGLLQLHSAWVNGAVIVAGLGVPPADPVVLHPRACVECDLCPTWLLGDTKVEAGERLAEHQRHRHA